MSNEQLGMKNGRGRGEEVKKWAVGSEQGRGRGRGKPQRTQRTQREEGVFAGVDKALCGFVALCEGLWKMASRGDAGTRRMRGGEART
jgi:hypothetical protein